MAFNNAIFLFNNYSNSQVLIVIKLKLNSYFTYKNSLISIPNLHNIKYNNCDKIIIIT